jgi:hypothetical protein
MNPHPHSHPDPHPDPDPHPHPHPHRYFSLDPHPDPHFFDADPQHCQQQQIPKYIRQHGKFGSKV